MAPQLPPALGAQGFPPLPSPRDDLTGLTDMRHRLSSHFDDATPMPPPRQPQDAPPFTQHTRSRTRTTGIPIP
jgi:hypothetical protein